MEKMRKMKPSGVEWIGDIPQEWEVIKLKYVSDFKQIKYAEEYGELNYIGLENIISWNGMYLETSSQYDREQSLICEENDILFGKLRPYLAKVYLNTKRQCCSSEFCVIKVLKNNTKYFWYQFISHGFIFMVDRSTYGTKMPRANSDFIRSLYVSIPPFSEQKRIAAFLDRKCAEIDSVISKTKATIEQYKSLKQSVITQAVTKGIRPDRPMKDSGIEWIGEIPQEWDCNITKRFCTFKTGSTPSTTNQEWFDGELNWFTPSDFNESYYLSKSSRTLSVKAKQDNVATIIPNNTVMIIGIGGTAGKIGLTMCECSCNQQITALINSPRLLSKYLMYWMITNTKYIKETALFTTLPIINNQTIGSYPIIVPSDLSEQLEIADYLDCKCAEIDRLIAAKEQLLTELESYKKSVIYEYVTGKKEI